MATKKTVSIYDELSKAGGGVTSNEGESQQDFLVRLTDVVSKIEDEEFNKLSEPARKWFNESGTAINDNKLSEIPELSGLPEMGANEPPEQEEEAQPEQPATPTKKESKMKPKVNVKDKAATRAATKAKESAKATPGSAGKAKTKLKSGRPSTLSAKYPDAAKIRVLVKENPKREGTQSHKIFSLYSKSGTVENFLKAGGKRTDVAWAVEHKLISIS